MVLVQGYLVINLGKEFKIIKQNFKLIITIV
jgi:hypothetical protein